MDAIEIGDIFSVPLTAEVFALGLVTQAAGGVRYGWFFGPYKELPSDDLSSHLRSCTPLHRSLFGSTGIEDKSWHHVGKIEITEDFSMPLIFEGAKSTKHKGKVSVLHFSEKNLLDPIDTIWIDEGDPSLALMPRAGLSGALFVENRLRSLVGLTQEN